MAILDLGGVSNAIYKLLVLYLGSWKSCGSIRESNYLDLNPNLDASIELRIDFLLVPLGETAFSMILLSVYWLNSFFSSSLVAGRSTVTYFMIFMTMTI